MHGTLAAHFYPPLVAASTQSNGSAVNRASPAPIDVVYSNGFTPAWRSDSYGCLDCNWTDSLRVSFTQPWKSRRSHMSLPGILTHCPSSLPVQKRDASMASLYASMAPWSALIFDTDMPFAISPNT